MVVAIVTSNIDSGTVDRMLLLASTRWTAVMVMVMASVLRFMVRVCPYPMELVL